MKNLFYILVIATSAVTLAACEKHYHHPHHGDFCPPGQAKKGNC